MSCSPLRASHEEPPRGGARLDYLQQIVSHCPNKSNHCISLPHHTEPAFPSRPGAEPYPTDTTPGTPKRSRHAFLAGVRAVDLFILVGCMRMSDRLRLRQSTAGKRRVRIRRNLNRNERRDRGQSTLFSGLLHPLANEIGIDAVLQSQPRDRNAGL